jgi:hypothetical protein
MARRFFLLALMLFGLITFAPSVASAQSGFGPGGSGVGGDNFGPWYPKPGASGSSKFYRSHLQPFSSVNVAEIVDFGCFGPNGRPFTSKEKEVLGMLFQDASAAYYGTLVKDSDGSNDRENDNNWAKKHGTGERAMRAFLNDQYDKIYRKDWDHYSDPDDNDNNGDIRRASWRQLLPFIPAPDNRSPANGNTNRSRFDGRAGAAGPTELTMLVDEGCQISPILVQTPGGLGAFLKDPGEWVTDLMLYIPTRVTSGGYNFLEPYAFKFSFFTPHTERGDTFFNIASTCNPKDYGTYDSDGKQISGISRGDQQMIQDTCASGTPLGFSKSHLDVRKQNSWFIVVSQFLQWLISGLYFLILFTSAVVYMMRGSRAANFNVVQLIPRLFLSALLTILAPWLIGLAITVSNTFVQAMFDTSDGRSIGAISDLVRQAGVISGAPDDLISRVVQLIVGAITTFYFGFFAIVSLLRQVLLIGLVTLAPLAMFCLLVPAWHKRFYQWIKGTLLVVFAPAMMAFILKLGMAINPVLQSAGGATGLLGFLGVFALLITLWLMAKALKLSISATLGTQMPSLTGQALLGAGGILGIVGQTSGGKMGALARGGSAVANAAGSAATASNDVGGSLVPSNRQLGGFLSGGGAGGGTGGGVAGLLGGGGGRGGRGLHSALMGGAHGMGGAGWFQTKMMERQAEHGEIQVTGATAMRHKAARKRALEEQQARLAENGQRMDRRAKKAFLQQYDASRGEIVRRGRQWVRIMPQAGGRSPGILAQEHEAISRQLEQAMGRRLSRGERSKVRRDLEVMEFGEPRTGRRIERLEHRLRRQPFAPETISPAQRMDAETLFRRNREAGMEGRAAAAAAERQVLEASNAPRPGRLDSAEQRVRGAASRVGGVFGTGEPAASDSGSSMPPTPPIGNRVNVYDDESDVPDGTSADAYQAPVSVPAGPSGAQARDDIPGLRPNEPVIIPQGPSAAESREWLRDYAEAASDPEVPNLSAAADRAARERRRRRRN